MHRRGARGFTLIELMLVVAIIGILAAVAIPKFSSLMRKGREASTKANLGVIRSAIYMYYSANEGIYPYNLSALTNKQTYLDKIPPSWTYEYGAVTTVTGGP